MKRTIHDPKLFALPYPHNLMLAIAKADLIDPETKEHKPPVIDVDSNLEKLIMTVPLAYNLTNYEALIITYHYKYHDSLAKIATHFKCTSENILTHRNHALNRLLEAYLETKPRVDEPADELPTLEPRIISEIKEQLAHATLVAKPNEPLIPKHVKAAKNSIKHRKVHKRVKQVIPYKFYIRSDGVLYVEIKDEIAQHYIGEFYSYSNSNFSIEGIVVDISIAGILLTDWEVKCK